mmetsp:Transcript_1661/g.3350  ORF Transcript_1661/g.3350 Transcript_1661/m.3350 type:complete len:445 (+) Transcript_1661:375-1709(+)
MGASESSRRDGNRGRSTHSPTTAVGVPVASATAATVSEVATPTPPSCPQAATPSGPMGDPSKDSTATLLAESSKLDLVFTMDCTGSMGSYIANAKQNIELIVRRLADAEGYDLRFGLVAYRDHPPQDRTFITKTFPFTADVSQMRRNLNELRADGGGDGPEAVGAALRATRTVPWRHDATKICVLIADAPPHGLGESGDGFPDGEPDGSDPIAELDQLSALGVALYAVGCQPALSRYKFATDFFVMCAERTNGQAVSLSSAAALADVIMGGAIEEMDLTKLTNELERDVQQMRLAQPALDEEELVKQVHGMWKAKGVRSRSVKCEALSAEYGAALREAASIQGAKASFEAAEASRPRGAMGSKYASSAASLAPARTLSSSKTFKKKISSSKAAAAHWSVSEATGPSAPSPMIEESAAPVEIAMDDISYEQVSRLYGKCRKTGKL